MIVLLDNILPDVSHNKIPPRLLSLMLLSIMVIFSENLIWIPPETLERLRFLTVKLVQLTRITCDVLLGIITLSLFKKYLIGFPFAILFIHSSGSTLKLWDDNIPALSRDFHTIAIDLPGHGESSGKSLSTIKEYYDVVLNFIKEKNIA